MTIEADIVSHLTAKWSPEVILLGGSRSVGEEVPGSDWDLYLIGNYPSRHSFPERLGSAHLDVEVQPRSDISGDILRIFYGPVRGLRVLKESSDKLGARIVEQTRLAYTRGPVAKDSATLELDRSEMSRSAAKILSHSSDPEACFTNLGLFHRMAVQYWFEKRGSWPLPPHTALPIIRQEDPEFASNLERIAGIGAIEIKIRACSSIQKLIWGI